MVYNGTTTILHKEEEEISSLEVSIFLNRCNEEKLLITYRDQDTGELIEKLIPLAHHFSPIKKDNKYNTLVEECLYNKFKEQSILLLESESTFDKEYIIKHLLCLLDGIERINNINSENYFRNFNIKEMVKTYFKILGIGNEYSVLRTIGIDFVLNEFGITIKFFDQDFRKENDDILRYSDRSCHFSITSFFDSEIYYNNGNWSSITPSNNIIIDDAMDYGKAHNLFYMDFMVLLATAELIYQSVDKDKDKFKEILRSYGFNCNWLKLTEKDKISVEEIYKTYYRNKENSIFIIDDKVVNNDGSM